MEGATSSWFPRLSSPRPGGANGQKHIKQGTKTSISLISEGPPHGCPLETCSGGETPRGVHAREHAKHDTRMTICLFRRVTPLEVPWHSHSPSPTRTPTLIRGRSSEARSPGKPSENLFIAHRTPMVPQEYTGFFVEHKSQRGYTMGDKMFPQRIQSPKDTTTDAIRFL